eukprot:TRINITY_DN10236_c0_g1_i3.p1 TRINITY_DN10236_c0_g1~~TRINITY_DN10236_c0_g1_i3.p1  ORF type:complete len:107 (+),score=5.49 TRINITY_DN10236_c0_g1_i3:446-766(+)
MIISFTHTFIRYKENVLFGPSIHNTSISTLLFCCESVTSIFLFRSPFLNIHVGNPITVPEETIPTICLDNIFHFSIVCNCRSFPNIHPLHIRVDEVQGQCNKSDLE